MQTKHLITLLNQICYVSLKKMEIHKMYCYAFSKYTPLFAFPEEGGQIFKRLT